MMFTTLLIATALALPPQDHDAEAAEEMASYELVLEYYRPQRASADSLLRLMNQLTASGFFSHKVQMGGGSYVLAEPALLLFGDTLLVKDSRGEIAETMAQLRELDALYEEPGEGGGRASGGELLTFQLSHIAIGQAEGALFSLFRAVTPTPAGAGEAPPTLSFVPERNLVLVRGTKAQVREAKTVLERLDVPRPRVMLSCYVVAGAESAGGDGRVPADLAADLGQLVPYAGFDLLSSAFLPSDTSGPLRLKVELDGRDGDLELSMRPVAYDADTGTLTLGTVDFELSLLEDSRKNRRAFTTSTNLRNGEYTVLGAVGADPVFVVIKLSAQ